MHWHSISRRARSILFSAGKEFAAKAVELGQEYGKDALEKTGQLYEAGKGKAEELIKDARKKLDL